MPNLAAMYRAAAVFWAEGMALRAHFFGRRNRNALGAVLRPEGI